MTPNKGQLIFRAIKSIKGTSENPSLSFFEDKKEGGFRALNQTKMTDFASIGNLFTTFWKTSGQIRKRRKPLICHSLIWSLLNSSHG